MASRFYEIYRRNGVVALLQEATRLALVAVAATPDGHPERPGRLDTLGVVLATRFGKLGALEDLQEAIRRSEEAVAVTPVDHPDRAGRLNDLGNRLSTRFQRIGALEDLQKAIRLGEEAVAATPVNHPDRAGRLNNLGNRLMTRTGDRGSPIVRGQSTSPRHKNREGETQASGVADTADETEARSKRFIYYISTRPMGPTVRVINHRVCGTKAESGEGTKRGTHSEHPTTSPPPTTSRLRIADCTL